MKIRTDLAMESPFFSGEIKNYSGIVLKESIEKDIRLVKLDVINRMGEEKTGRTIGTYITIEADKLSETDDEYHNKISCILKDELKNLIMKKYKSSSKVPEILVAGLGNIEATPDSLGPKTVSHLCITAHIQEEEFPDRFATLRAISPGVMAQTGMESADIIGAVVKKTEPDILIVIDSLAARNLNRLTSTIQISSAGIEPGSGVGNHRNAINHKTMGIPVIAIGVPTVVDAATLIFDAINPKEEWNPDKYRSMYVTSKDIDAIVNRISYTISEAINSCMCN